LDLSSLVRWNYGFFILIHDLSRNQLLEFGEKVLRLKPNHLVNTPAFDLEFQEAAVDTDNLFRAKVLAYSISTRKGHASAIKGFLQFCEVRELNPFECTPSILSLYMLAAAQAGKTVGVFDSFLNAWSFICRFFMCTDYTKESSVAALKKFAEKACTKKSNKKLPFGSAEIRKIWDRIDAEKGGVQNLNFKDLRTFMISVFNTRLFADLRI
jgi:hypothetical protein